MQRVLVTGGCGFIGSNFVRRFLASVPAATVVNLDKLTYAGNLMNLDGLEAGERHTFVRGGIEDEALVGELFRTHDFDTVVNFAAESHVDRSILEPAGFIRTNIVGTHALLDAARRHWGREAKGRRFLQVSTDEVFGSLGETGRFDEKTPYDPRSPYSASKASADHLARAYHHTFGIPVLVTNCSNNYGPYQFPEKLIPLVILNARDGRPIPVYGDGRNIRDWLHVDDHCDAIIRVLEAGAPGETYCIGGNSEKRNLEVVETICDLVDRSAAPLPGGKPRRSLITFVTDRPGHDRRYAIDASRIRDELGWSPSIGFVDGIAKTVAWYLAHRDWIDAVADGRYREYYDRLYGGR